MMRTAFWLLIAANATALAQDSGQKAGLWEFKVVRQMMDGHDMLEQMAAARHQMEQGMLNMPPEQRKRMEATTSRMSASDAGATTHRICISEAMAARNEPIVDPQGHCQTAKIDRSGNKTRFEFNCMSQGRGTAGKGESAVTGDTISTQVDMTTTGPGGNHTLQNETTMKYLGRDCQGVKPLDELTKGQLKGIK